MNKIGERTVVTSDLLIEMFGHLDIEAFVRLMAPFIEQSDEQARAKFRDLQVEVRGFESEDEGEARGKEILLEGIEDLIAAFEKLSEMEKAAIRRTLPEKIGRLIASRLKRTSCPICKGEGSFAAHMNWSPQACYACGGDGVAKEWFVQIRDNLAAYDTFQEDQPGPTDELRSEHVFKTESEAHEFYLGRKSAFRFAGTAGLYVTYPARRPVSPSP